MLSRSRNGSRGAHRDGPPPILYSAQRLVPGSTMRHHGETSRPRVRAKSTPSVSAAILCPPPESFRLPVGAPKDPRGIMIRSAEKCAYVALRPRLRTASSSLAGELCFPLSDESCRDAGTSGPSITMVLSSHTLPLAQQPDLVAEPPCRIASRKTRCPPVSLAVHRDRDPPHMIRSRPSPLDSPTLAGPEAFSTAW